MMFSSDEFDHLKIPLESILIATNNFAGENLWGEEDFGNSYRGQLLWSGELIKIDARRFNKDDEIEQMFWTEISMLSSLKHKNLVSLVGFCDENDEKIIIIKDENWGSLGNYLSDSMQLTWVRRLEISVGIAQALSYIHYYEPRDFSVIHRLISSSRVLLNDEWEPKLSCFECSMKIEAFKRHHSFHTNKLRYVEGYGDPTYIETKSVNHKSDIYSFGILLFELLCGRKSISEHPENIIQLYKLGQIFKGRLLHSEQFIDIIVKRFYLDYVKDESKNFWTEVSMLSSLKHKNLVSIIGFVGIKSDRAYGQSKQFPSIWKFTILV